MSSFWTLLRRATPALLLLIPLSLILQHPNGFPYPSVDAKFSDFSISHYPNAVFLKQQIFEEGKFPLWSPTILSGYPFAANPLSGLWYLPGWLALVFPLPLGINLAAALHMYMGGLGLYVLLRKEKLGKAAALFGALVFESAPKLVAHYGAGHVTLIYAISWTPWLLWSGKEALEKRGKWNLLPGIFLGLTILADPRWALFAGLLWAGTVFWCSLIHYDKRGDSEFKSSGILLGSLKRMGGTSLVLAGQGVLGLLISGPLLVPFMEYVSLSTRNRMEAADLLTFSLPPERISSFFFPDFGGHHESMVYTGAVVLMLVINAFLGMGKSRQQQFWLWSGLISFLYALGSNGPLATILSNLPGFDLVRVPSRALFVTSLSLAAAAAHTIDVLLKRKPIRCTKWADLGIFGITTFVIFVGIGLWAYAPNHPWLFLYGAAMCLLSSIWIKVRIRACCSRDEDGTGKEGKEARVKWVIPAVPWYLGLFVLAAVDLGIVDSSLLTFRSKEKVLAEGADAAAYIASQEGLFRVYSPSYSLPQSTAMFFGIPLVDGVDPLQLEAYAGFMEEATGVPISGYHVTIPPFVTGNPVVDNQEFILNADLLGHLNVAYVVSAFEIDAEGLVLEGVYGGNFIYRNSLSRPRGWVTQNGGSLKSEELPYQPVQITDYSSNQVEVIANGPGILTLSEIAYPGWSATVDGKPAAIGVDSPSLFRIISLEDGEHLILYKFKPVSVLWGLILLGTGVILLVILFLLKSKPGNE